ncbi:hypothetical protein D3C86_2094520 [compost metagenome]
MPKWRWWPKAREPFVTCRPVKCMKPSGLVRHNWRAPWQFMDIALPVPISGPPRWPRFTANWTV